MFFERTKILDPFWRSLHGRWASPASISNLVGFTMILRLIEKREEGDAISTDKLDFLSWHKIVNGGRGSSISHVMGSFRLSNKSTTQALLNVTQRVQLCLTDTKNQKKLIIYSIKTKWNLLPLGYNTKVIKVARCRFVFEKTIGTILVDFSTVNFSQLPITLRQL